MKIDLSIIIINYNVYSDVVNCIESVYRTIKGVKYEIIVVDNNSPDRSIEQIPSAFENVKLILLPENFGFGYANNKAFEDSNGEHLLFVNPDIVFDEGTINGLVDFLKKTPDAGCAGPLIRRTDNSIQYYYTFFPSVYSRLMQEFGLYEKARKMKFRRIDFLNNNISNGIPFKVDWVLGACMVIPRNLFAELGGFDDSFFLYEEEVDLLYRMRQRELNTYFVPNVTVIHNHNTSTSKLGFAFIRYHGFRSIVIFVDKHSRGFKRILDKLLLMFGTTFRLLRGILIKRFRVGDLSTHLKLFFDLYKLNLLGASESSRSHAHFLTLSSFLQDESKIDS